MRISLQLSKFLVCCTSAGPLVSSTFLPMTKFEKFFGVTECYVLSLTASICGSGLQKLKCKGSGIGLAVT